MQIQIDLTDQEIKLLHTFTRRLIFEDLIRPMYESNDTKEQTENRVYATFHALGKIQTELEKAL